MEFKEDGPILSANKSCQDNPFFNNRKEIPTCYKEMF